MSELQITDLEGMKLTELYKLAKQHQIPYYGKLKKRELIFAILRAQAEQERSYVYARCIRNFIRRLWIS